MCAATSLFIVGDQTSQVTTDVVGVVILRIVQNKLQLENIKRKKEMKTKRITKKMAKARQVFLDTLVEYFVGLGARAGRFYDMELDTPAGLLHVTVNDTWVATRFDDPKRARQFVDCNPYSGKWNFHVNEGSAESLHPDVVIPYINFFFRELMGKGDE
jgi:hypothetical protein